jgi:hypothetical protein
MLKNYYILKIPKKIKAEKKPSKFTALAPNQDLLQFSRQACPE